MVEQIIIGLIVAAILATLAILRKKIAKYLSKATLKPFGSFLDWNAAEADVVKNMEKSCFLYILTGRGNFLLSGGNSDKNPYFKYFSDKNNEVIVLLPNIYDKDRDKKWIKQRVEEMKDVKNAMITEIDAFEAQVNAVIMGIEKAVLCVDKRLIALFDSFHIGKIILLDEVAYFQPYLSDIDGKDGRVYRYKKKSDMYKWLERLVLKTKDFATPISDYPRGKRNLHLGEKMMLNN